MIYIISEYASQGEIFGKYIHIPILYVWNKTKNNKYDID